MTALPPSLVPATITDLTLPSGSLVKIPTARPIFSRWRGEPLQDSFGGKPTVESNGAACFAELAILRLFLSAGWSGRWVEMYGAPTNQPKFLLEWAGCGIKAERTVPPDDAVAVARLAAIASRNRGRYSGCWDVVAWADGRIVFAESKWSRKGVP
ncbi:MAG: hypothetical protein H6Q33_784 [Deltaproteobacteria bacterium]|nr:hypothetical protein [Deltaproteobacteria bacterium]